MTYVVDASVVIKWLVPEEGSDRAAELLSEPVAAPDLLVAECVNALWKQVAWGNLTEKDAASGAALLAAAGISFEPTQALARDILALALRLKHPAYDCAYLALARKLDGILVTADRKLIERCLQPDAADLAPHVRSLYQLGREVQEKRPRPYRARRRAA